MKLQIKETIEREVEITFPCYRKDMYWVAKVISESEVIQVSTFEVTRGNGYFIIHRYDTVVTEFFQGNFTEATEEDFETALRETKRRLLADVNAQIFQQEKAA